MAEPGTTALLALVPAAEPLLRIALEVDAAAVRPKVPAHATLLYPWLPADQLGPPELERLRAALPAGLVPIRLTGIERTGGFVAAPVPELSALATAARTAFPGQVPYGGRFGQDPPVHVTVALDADPGAAAEIARRATTCLPIATEISALHAVALTPTGWQLIAELPLVP